MSQQLIERDEVVALLFNVGDIATSLSGIQALLECEDGEEEEPGGD